MVQSKLTTKVGLNGRTSPQYSSRNGAKIDRIILHHQASTNGMGGVNMMVNATKQVSANYVVLSDGTVVLVVPEELRAWTSSSASWDGRAVTFEVENSTMGPNWLISAAAEEKLAQMVADIATRYGFPINRNTVIGHRELNSRYGASYATACPGGMRLDWIVARAVEIQREGVAPTPPVVAEVIRKAEDGMTMFVHKDGKNQALYEYDAITGALEVTAGYSNASVVAKMHEEDTTKLPVLNASELDMVNNRAAIRRKLIVDDIVKALKS